MIEKTLRYPGHIELMKIFREVGFFSEKEIDLKGKSIKPIDLTAKLLFPFCELLFFADQQKKTSPEIFTQARSFFLPVNKNQ